LGERVKLVLVVPMQYVMVSVCLFQMLEIERVETTQASAEFAGGQCASASARTAVCIPSLPSAEAAVSTPG